MKLIEFPKKSEPKAGLPSEEVLRDLLLDKPMQSCILITVNEDGEMSYWVDGTNTYEGVGLLESCKLSMLNQMLNTEDFE